MQTASRWVLERGRPRESSIKWMSPRRWWESGNTRSCPKDQRPYLSPYHKASLNITHSIGSKIVVSTMSIVKRSWNTAPSRGGSFSFSGQTGMPGSSLWFGSGKSRITTISPLRVSKFNCWGWKAGQRRTSWWGCSCISTRTLMTTSWWMP